MKIISVIQEKGGVGKSLVCFLLAGEFGADYTTTIIDTDPQGSNERLSRINPDLPFTCVHVRAGQDLTTVARQAANSSDLVIIDTQPRADSYLVAATLADLVLIPTRPTMGDIHPLTGLVPKIRELAPARLVYNFYRRNTIAHRQGAEQAPALLGIPALKSTLSSRIVYEEISFEAPTIHEAGDEMASLEVKALRRELERLLKDLEE